MRVQISCTAQLSVPESADPAAQRVSEFPRPPTPDRRVRQGVLNHELGLSMHRSYPLTPATNLEKKPTNSIRTSSTTMFRCEEVLRVAAKTWPKRRTCLFSRWTVI
jgi:hypothetical protein